MTIAMAGLKSVDELFGAGGRLLHRPMRLGVRSQHTKRTSGRSGSGGAVPPRLHHSLHYGMVCACFYGWRCIGGHRFRASNYSPAKRSPFVIELTKEEQVELDARSKEYTSPYRVVMRAKIVLLASQRLGNDRIAARLGMPRQIISKWRQRFYYERLPGLDDQPRGGRPARFSPLCHGCDQGAYL